MKKVINFLEKVNYWTIVFLPLAVGIAQGVGNSVAGIMIGSFLILKILKKEKIFTLSLPIALFGLFMLTSLVSFYNSSNLHDSIKGMLKLLKFLMIMVVCSESIKDKKHFERIALGIGCAVCLLGFDALWQRVVGWDFIRRMPLQYAIGLPRVTASLPGCNGLGVYLTALTPIVSGLAIFLSGLRRRIFFLLAAGLGSIGVYLTFSRGAGLGLFVAILFLSLVKKNKILTSILIALLIIFPFLMPKNIKDWAKSVKYNPIIMLTNEDRIGIYLNVINMIKHHPFAGIGINTFCRSYNNYRVPEVEKIFPTNTSLYAHNNFLHMAAEVGLLGLGVFLVFLVSVFRAFWFSYKKNPEPFLKALSISLFAALLAYLINGLTETSLYYSRIVMVFWLIVGIGLALKKDTQTNSFNNAQ